MTASRIALAVSVTTNAARIIVNLRVVRSSSIVRVSLSEASKQVEISVRRVLADASVSWPIPGILAVSACLKFFTAGDTPHLRLRKIARPSSQHEMTLHGMGENKK